MNRGAAAHEKNGATTSQNMTAITTLHNRFLNSTQTANTKPDVALAHNIRRKIRQEALDPRSSFRDDQLASDETEIAETADSLQDFILQGVRGRLAL